MIRGLIRSVLTTALVACAGTVQAQSLGTYSWQLAPYCNVVTVNVTQTGSTYTLDGYDTQCGGASNRAPATGMAVPNPNGSIGLGFSIVTSPGGAPVHVDASLTLPSLNGTWRDSLGNTGSFVFAPSGAASGSPRPPAAAGIPDGSITTPKLADGAVDAAKVNTSQVQQRVMGTCPSGQSISGVNQDGSVACEPVTSSSGGDITAVVAGTGLVGGNDTGEAALAVDFAQVQKRVSAACPANQTIQSINADGTVACDDDDDSGGDITAVTAGTGLAGGGETGALSLSVRFAGTGAATFAARSDHTHDAGGTANTRVGEGALLVAGGPGGHTAVGFMTMGSQAGGAIGNTGLGANVLRKNEEGDGNTAIGNTALFNGTDNQYNTVVGYRTLVNGGERNTTVGGLTLTNSAPGTHDNTAIGYEALTTADGHNNTALGAGALANLNTGDGNIALGVNAGSFLTDGADNIYIGSGGNSVDEGTIRIGRTAQSRTFIAGIVSVNTGVNNAVPVVIDTNGQLGTVSSTRRTKFDIADMASTVSGALQRLRPVQFRYLQAFADGSTPIQYGLIAEEVQDVLPELVALDGHGQPQTVKYHVLPSLLLAEVQRLERERHAQGELIEQLRDELTAVKAQLAQMDRR